MADDLLGLGLAQAARGAAAGELSGKTVQPGPGLVWLEGGGGAVALCSTVSQGSRSWPIQVLVKIMLTSTKKEEIKITNEKNNKS